MSYITEFVDNLRQSVSNEEKLPLEKLEELLDLTKKAIEIAYIEPYCDITNFVPITYVREVGFAIIASKIGYDTQFVVDNVKTYLQSKEVVVVRLKGMFVEEGQVEEADDDEEPSVNEVLRLLRDDKKLTLINLLSIHEPDYVSENFPFFSSMPMKNVVQWYLNLFGSLSVMVREAEAEAQASGSGGGRRKNVKGKGKGGKNVGGKKKEV